MVKVIRRWYERNFHDEEAVLLLLLLVVGVAVVVFYGGILTPVIGALVLAFLLQGLVGQLLRWRCPHLLAVSLSTLLLVTIMVVSLIGLLPLVRDQGNNMVQELPRIIALLQEQLGLLPERYPGFLTPSQAAELSELLNRELRDFGQQASTFLIANISNIFSFIVYLILVPIMVFFFLKDKDLLLGWCGRFLPEERPLLNTIYEEMNDQMANYVRGKAIEMFIVGGVSFFAFSWLELNYAALLAILVGLSVIVPYIGAFLVTIPVLLVAFLQWGWGSEFIWLSVIYFLIQALDGNVLVPLLFSEAVNLHPIAILLAILFFGGIWGLWGVFFAIPLATLIKAVLNAWPNLEERGDAAQSASEADA